VQLEMDLLRKEPYSLAMLVSAFQGSQFRHELQYIKTNLNWFDLNQSWSNLIKLGSVF
jgi:hypothetical protein